MKKLIGGFALKLWQCVVYEGHFYSARLWFMLVDTCMFMFVSILCLSISWREKNPGWYVYNRSKVYIHCILLLEDREYANRKKWDKCWWFRLLPSPLEERILIMNRWVNHKLRMSSICSMLCFNINYFAQLSFAEIRDSATKHKCVQTKRRTSPFKGTASDMQWAPLHQPFSIIIKWLSLSSN